MTSRQEHIDYINAGYLKIENNAHDESASKKLRLGLPIARIACDQLIAEVQAMGDDQLASYSEAGREDWMRVIGGRIGKLQKEVR